jgi:5-methylcytosine-specific restriction endonuclease McrA
VTPEELLDFIETTMKTQEIYQPVLIAALLDAGGQATIRQLAVSLLAADEAAIDAAAARLNRMPLPVLRKHTVVERVAKGVWKLTTPALTHTERARLAAACHVRLADYLDKAGPIVSSQGHIGTGMRKQVFDAAFGRCLYCRGVDEPLEVDHVRPQSAQGVTALSNLQAICKPCNIAKGVAWIDYRPMNHPHRPQVKPEGVTAYWDDKNVVWGPTGHQSLLST